MSFDIKIQRNQSEKNKLTKTLDDIATLTGELKAETSLINPVIVVEASIATVRRANYLTIDSFKRGYFITGIKSIRAGLYEISAHVDVLSSYAEEIRENAGIVKRQEAIYNKYLNDGVFKCYQNPHILTKIFPSGFTGESFILGVAGYGTPAPAPTT